MSIKAKRSEKQSGKNKRKTKEQKRAGVLESTTQVMIRKSHNDEERTLSLLFFLFLSKTPNKGATTNVHNE